MMVVNQPYLPIVQAMAQSSSIIAVRTLPLGSQGYRVFVSSFRSRDTMHKVKMHQEADVGLNGGQNGLDHSIRL